MKSYSPGQFSQIVLVGKIKIISVEPCKMIGKEELLHGS